MTSLGKSTYYSAAPSVFLPSLHEDNRFARAFAFVDQTSLCTLQPRDSGAWGHRLGFTSGQLGISADETIPRDCEAQADLCFANIAAILAEDHMTLADVVRINAYVTDREHMQGYMRSRDRQFQGTPPASTLTIVTGFTKPEFLVEIEVVAATPERD